MYALQEERVGEQMEGRCGLRDNILKRPISTSWNEDSMTFGKIKPSTSHLNMNGTIWKKSCARSRLRRRKLNVNFIFSTFIPSTLYYFFLPSFSSTEANVLLKQYICEKSKMLKWLLRLHFNTLSEKHCSICLLQILDSALEECIPCFCEATLKTL